MSPQEMSTKKALFIIGSLVAFAGITLILPAKYLGVKPVKKPALVLATQEDFVALQEDANNNNVPDWKDLLNRTMSTTTKAEVSKATPVDTAAQKRLSDPNNITASFSKNIYTASMYATDKELTEEEQGVLADKLLASEGAKMTFKEYKVEDLSLTKVETDASKKAYINALAVTYKKALAAKITANDLETIKAFTVGKDTSVLKSLVVKKNILETIIKDLVATTVPYSAAPYHLLIINSISKYKSVLENIAKAEEDPLRASLALNAYTTSVTELYTALRSLQPYIAIENIQLSTKDPGFILVSGEANP